MGKVIEEFDNCILVHKEHLFALECKKCLNVYYVSPNCSYCNSYIKFTQEAIKKREFLNMLKSYANPI